MSRLHTGMRIGRWLLLERTVMTKRAKWRARCDCGSVKEVAASSLLAKTSSSCGCLRSEMLSESNLTHGESGTPLYRVWASMKDRCLNPDSEGFKDYGARGITIDSDWLEFERFKQDTGDRPSDIHSLERKNNDLGYCKSNVEWALPKVQARNRRGLRVIEYRGRSQCLSAWAEELGVSMAMLSTRLNRQRLGVEEAFTRPSRYKEKK